MMRTDTYDLKPCPFCGSKSVRVLKQEDESLWSHEAAWYSHVTCCECDAQTSPICDDPEAEQAIAAWNRRTPPVSAQSVEPVYQIRAHDLSWLDVRKSSYEGHALVGDAEFRRVLYTAPPNAEDARDAALEEAASMCDSYTRTKHNNGQSCAAAIRALKSKKEA